MFTSLSSPVFQFWGNPLKQYIHIYGDAEKTQQIAMTKNMFEFWFPLTLLEIKLNVEACRMLLISMVMRRKPITLYLHYMDSLEEVYSLSPLP